MKIELTDIQIKLFEKYYTWGDNFIQNWDVNDKHVVGVYFKDLQNLTKILRIYRDGTLAVHHEDTMVARPAFLGWVTEETMDKLFRLKTFL